MQTIVDLWPLNSGGLGVAANLRWRPPANQDAGI
jgi:hypothetical protein